MPRRRTERVHTSPEKAGAQNMKGMTFPKDEDGIMDKLMPIKENGDYVRATYKGLWTEENLAQCIDEYFEYCQRTSFKPTVPSLIVWLGISRSQFYTWLREDKKYKFQSDILNTALGIMEAYLQANIDKYPTGSCFILRTTHGHVEKSKVDVTTNGKDISTSLDEVNEKIARLGL